jgi:hypothetical protein
MNYLKERRLDQFLGFWQPFAVRIDLYQMLNNYRYEAQNQPLYPALQQQLLL